MQILKDNTTGILFSPFAIGGVWHLQIAVLHYFALDRPDTALPEQDLWNECTAELGTAVLDAGFPKPRGEVLLAGCWYPPSHMPEKGGWTSFKAGPVSRRLAVFGPRYWRNMPMPVISEPQAVSFVPLTWESAFGGEGCPENRAGLGTNMKNTPWGETCLPLPLVEDPDAGIVTSPSSMPKPACPLPAAADRPSRLALAGTYDKRWQDEFWPGFPADINPEFFSCADPVQRLPKDYTGEDASSKPGFFAGGEEFLLENMHPQKARIAGRLPQKRVRVFVTRSLARTKAGCHPSEEELKADAQRAKEEQRFEEATARLETVWFFPGIERGVCLYRAVVPCLDDECCDIVSLFPVVEDKSAKETDIAFWLEEKKKRTPVLDIPKPSLPPEAVKAMAEMNAAVRTIEEDLHFSADKAMGRAPSVRTEPETLQAKSEAGIREALKSLERTEEAMQAVHAGTGKASMPEFDALRATLHDMLDKLAKAGSAFGMAKEHLTKCEKGMEAATQKTYELIDAIPPTEADQKIREGKEKLQAFEKESEQKTWSSQALSLLGRHALANCTDPEAQKLCEELRQCGLRADDIENAMLAYLACDTEVAPADLCLAGKDALKGLSLSENGRIVLPHGLVVPFFENSRCVCLHIRELKEDAADCFAPCKSFVVPGSGDGCQILGAIRPKPVLLAEDPLTAWLLYAQAGDIFAILLLTGRDAVLSDDAGKVFDEAPLIFWPVPPMDEKACHDGLAPESPVFTPAMRMARQEELAARWKGLASEKDSLIPVAWPDKWSTPSLAKAKSQGLDIRAWLIEELKKRGIRPARTEGSLSLEPDENGTPRLAMAIPEVDAKGIRKRLASRLNGLYDAEIKKLDGEMQKAVDQYNVIRAENGLAPLTIPNPSLDEVLHTPIPEEPDQATLKRFEELAEQIGRMNGPEDKAKVLAMREKYIEDLKKLSALNKKGREALIAQQASIKNGLLGTGDIPDWVKKVPGGEAALSEAAGQETGQSAAVPPAAAEFRAGVKGRTLKDLDLSGMDLRGMRLENCFLENIDLSNAVLDESKWKKVIATKVNLTGTSCVKSRFEQCSFTECICEKTNLQEASFELCQWQNGSMHDVAAMGAHIKLATLDAVSMQGTLEKAFIELSTFDKCQLEDLTLYNCRLRKTSFMNCLIRHMRAERGEWQESGFMSCKGSGLVIKNSACDNMRLVMHCDIGDACFEQCRLPALCLRESRLPALVMKGCSFDDAIADYCDLPRAVLAGCSGTNARFLHCDLEGADLRCLRLPQGSLRKSRLVQANLHSANLYGADMYKAVLGETDLTGANLAGTLLEGKKKEMKNMELSR